MTDPARANNFDALRLAFAGLVLVFHLVVLGGIPAPAWVIPALASCAQVSIEGFFIISGYLVYASYERSRGLADYAEKRVRRLGPGYATVVMAAALAALAVVPEARADLTGVARYLAANLVFLNFLAPTLPGVFVGHALPEVNGALWTLKIEVMFYLVVPVLAGLLGPSAHRSRRGLVLMLSIYVAAEVWRAGLGWYATTGVGAIWARLPHQLPGQMSFFVSGIALLRYRHTLLAHPAALLVVAAGLTIASLQPPWHPLRAAGLAGLVLWVAYAAPVRVPAARFGDLSYGVYILHCPIIQTLVALGVFTMSPWLGSAAALASVAAAALVLWWAVEKPVLRPDSHYRRVAGTGPV